MSPLILLALVVAVESGCGGISDTEIEGILNVHKTLRRTISNGEFFAKEKLMPAASTPIPDLTWDCALELSAQELADGCVWEHSEEARRGVIGENISIDGYYNDDPLTGKGAKASEAWASEFQSKGWEDIKLNKDA